MWFNQYITVTFFFTEHFKIISICFEVLRSLCWNIATMNYANGYMKIKFFGRHFVRLPLTDRWIGSEKGILHFTFTEIGCTATGPGDLQFTTDSLPSFGLNETFLIAKSEASMMWGDAMPYEMNEFTRKVSSTLLKKHHMLCLKKLQCLTTGAWSLVLKCAKMLLIRKTH